MNTAALIDTFLYSKKTKGVSPLTIKWYEQILRLFQSYHKKLPLKPSVIESFINSCPGGDERRHGYFRTLRCFYRFLERRNITNNPMRFIEPPKCSRKVPRTLTYQELNILLGYPRDPEIKASLKFLIDTGTRLGELYSLTPSCFRATP